MTYKYATTVPLIGGMTLAGRAVTGRDPDCLISYKAFADNEKPLRSYLPDVPYEVLDDGGSMTAGKDFDFISALCPCAGLSALGTGDDTKRDAANFWMFETAKHVLGTLKPKVFWGENAPAMYSQTSARAERVRTQLLEIAKANGYTATFYFTSTHMHGVPQRRHRTFYFFWRENGRVPIMNYWKRPTKTWGEYLAEVPANATQHDTDFDRAHKTLRATRFAKWANAEFGDSFPDTIRQRMIELGKNMWTIQDFVLADPNGSKLDTVRAWYDGLKDEKAVAYMDRIATKHADGKGVWDDSPAIFLPTGNFNALIGRTMDSAHPYEHRSLTIRESMHMMALPHDFQLTIKNTNAICQNVPMCTASDMQRDVCAYIDGKLPFADADVLFQSNFTESVDSARTIGSSKLLVF